MYMQLCTYLINGYIFSESELHILNLNLINFLVYCSSLFYPHLIAFTFSDSAVELLFRLLPLPVICIFENFETEWHSANICNQRIVTPVQNIQSLKLLYTIPIFQLRQLLTFWQLKHHTRTQCREYYRPDAEFGNCLPVTKRKCLWNVSNLTYKFFAHLKILIAHCIQIRIIKIWTLTF